MARFSLKEGSSPQDIGKIVVDAAYARARGASPTKSEIAKALLGHFDTTKESAPEIEVCFDTPAVLHFVIPDVDPKDAEQPPPGKDDPGYHLAKIAYEAMGTVVIRGCGK